MNHFITFGNLLAMLPDSIIGTKPTPKYLKENDTPLLVSEDGKATVYKSGYIYYRSVNRDVVLNAYECQNFTYEMKKWICPLPRKEDVLIMDWYTVIVLKGEEQAALNLENDENDHRYKENIDTAAMVDFIPDNCNLEESLVNKLYVEEQGNSIYFLILKILVNRHFSKCR